MPAGKAMLEAAESVEGSTIVTVMARNGTDFGIRLASMPERWFTAPAGKVQGLYRPAEPGRQLRPGEHDPLRQRPAAGGPAQGGRIRAQLSLQGRRVERQAGP